MIEVLRVVGAFGIGGCLRVALLSDNLTSYRKIYDKNSLEFPFRLLRFMGKSKAIISMDGITDRTAAESLKNEYFYVQRCDLPSIAENEFYICDLVGKDVIVEDSDIKCKIVGAQNFGAGDLLEISHDGGSFFVPFAQENFPNSKGEILITRKAFEGFKN